jgi:hypothetical protein
MKVKPNMCARFRRNRLHANQVRDNTVQSGKRDRHGLEASRAAACALRASLGAVANISYGLWAEWWVATIFVGAALAGALAVYRVR